MMVRYEYNDALDGLLERFFETYRITQDRADYVPEHQLHKMHRALYIDFKHGRRAIKLVRKRQRKDLKKSVMPPRKRIMRRALSRIARVFRRKKKGGIS
jgi:hypothetical protein